MFVFEVLSWNSRSLTCVRNSQELPSSDMNNYLGKKATFAMRTIVLSLTSTSCDCYFCAFSSWIVLRILTMLGYQCVVTKYRFLPWTMKFTIPFFFWKYWLEDFCINNLGNLIRPNDNNNKNIYYLYYYSSTRFEICIIPYENLAIHRFSPSSFTLSHFRLEIQGESSKLQAEWDAIRSVPINNIGATIFNL